MNYQIRHNLYFDTSKIKISIFVLILAIIILIINKKLKPEFVIPEKYKNKYLEFTYKFIIILIIIILTILPLNPQYIIGKKTVKERTLNIQFLFDTSLSMTATDILPYRFYTAKKTVIKVISNLKGHRISVIFFSKIPFIWIPFSNETDAIAEKLRETKMGDFPPIIDFLGTAIGDAIILGIKNILKNSTNPEKPGIIILITDGDSNKGSDPIDAAKVAANYNIPIYVLAIGKNEYIVGKDYSGSDVPTNINIPLLKKIAEISSGKFYRILKTEDFQKFINDLENIAKDQEKTKIIYKRLNITKFLYLILIILMILNIIFKLIIIYNSKNILKDENKSYFLTRL